jgi:vacuolar-type H+-ATPase subunit I/STV1
MYQTMLEPITAPLQYGPYLGASFLCVALFIWSQLAMNAFRKTFDRHVDSDDKSFADLQKMQSAILSQQTSALSSIRDIAESINHLADAITTQSEMHHEQLELLREQSGDIKIMLTNQTAAQGNLQKLLEQVVLKL